MSMWRSADKAGSAWGISFAPGGTSEITGGCVPFDGRNANAVNVNQSQ